MSSKPLALALALALVALVLPAALDGYWIHSLDVGLIFAILAVGLALTMGVAGQVNLAEVAFFGVGAYTTAVLTTSAQINFWWSLPISVGLALLVATVVGLPALRVQSHYLGIVTLGLAIAFSTFVINVPLLGGAAGISNIPSPAILGFAFDSPYSYYYLEFGFLVVGLVFAAFLYQSGLGLRLRAIRDDHIVAAAVGVHVGAMRVLAFGLGGLYGGLAGNLYAGVIGYVSPDTFSIFVMFELLAMVVIGGRQSIYGGMAGALLLSLGQALLINFQNFAQLGYGILIVAMVVLVPTGLAGLPRRLAALVRRGRALEGSIGIMPYQPSELADAVIPTDRLVVEVKGLTKRFGALKALDGVDISVREASIHGIVGPNGSGKTTLFNILTGIYRAEHGSARILDVDALRRRPDQLSRAGVARTFQNARLFRSLTVLENVLVATDQAGSSPTWEYLLAPWRVVARDRRARAWARSLLGELGLSTLSGQLQGELPYGIQRRVEIARALAGAPRLILLDEPAAGLNGDEVRELRLVIEGIRRRGITVVLIEHNMSLVMSLCDRVTVLNFGELLIDAEPSVVASDPSVIEAYLGRQAPDPAPRAGSHPVAEATS